MSDLYRKACDVKAPHRQPEMSGECDETCFVPDTQLQAIADAWAEYKTRASIGGEWTELAVLLDALGGTDNESVETPTTCEFGDLTCPCNDGDLCHYEGEGPMLGGRR